jgi:subtilisin family serine protease
MREFLTMIFSLLLGAALANPLSTAPIGGSDSNWAFQEIELAPALSYLQTKTEVIVAIIDTGIDTSHPDLRDHLWTHPGESGTDRWGRSKENNGVDDDANGFVDDVHGWNFVGNNNDVRDRHGHGTHIAGIISQIAPQAKIMILKYYDPNMPDDIGVAATPKAMTYARLNGARIVNYSSGGPGESSEEKKAVAALSQAGILFVAAAGNESQNSDHLQFYPADYGFPNILSVTAISEDKKILPSSNYGPHSVHIAAPGDDILSTLPGGGYGRMTGTSQATAFVSGVAALKLSTLPQNFKVTDLIDLLIKSGSWDESLKEKIKNPVVINSSRALATKTEKQDAHGEVISNTKDLPQEIFLSKKAFEMVDNAN